MSGNRWPPPRINIHHQPSFLNSHASRFTNDDPAQEYHQGNIGYTQLYEPQYLSNEYGDTSYIQQPEEGLNFETSNFDQLRIHDDYDDQGLHAQNYDIGQATTELQARVERLEAENQSQKNLLQDLMQERLAGLDHFQPISDADLGGELMKLQAQITDFSRFLRDCVGSNFETETSEYGKLALTLSQLSRSGIRKIGMKNVLESIVWKQLWKELFLHPFQSLGKDGQQILDTWGIIFGRAPVIPSPTEMSEKWRSITTHQLCTQMAEDDFGMKKEHRIRDGDPNTLDNYLQRIVEKGWEVATLFARQRCRSGRGGDKSPGRE
ncbi:uncharacterized protein Z518_02436 [Rhinocladiella mackenziei CBS 650.93]|uniref:Uncharacterized protein n=1 Tax=Rhinocladiella mackenziei CBS 650.93 TaxID=1442369 RepID=A0A0D2FZP2_9EURO|nr:uncharacterized protein Z518_02436 [Rhinocladiella mackenziei CBS 650.93]KIX07782.1 hypothetical protein Z518_02436 [Rhinocladiella mackenziei CBS 650.93]